MIVRDVMNKKVVVAKSEISIKKASEVMGKYHIGSLVVRDDEEIRGILTERDVLMSVARGKDPNATSIGEIMTKKVITIDPDSTLSDAVDLMIKHKIKKVPVVEEGKLIGIITASDIVVVEPKLVASIANLISMKLPGYRGG